jgi:hypothetical protein
MTIKNELIFYFFLEVPSPETEEEEKRNGMPYME